MSHERGDVVLATDPFKDDSSGRPFLLVEWKDTPFHGEQHIGLSLTTRTWHDESLPLEESDWVDGGAPERSSVMPWSVNSLRSEWIEYRQGRLTDELIDEAVEQLVGYVR